jgi:hypothetical protein
LCRNSETISISYGLVINHETCTYTIIDTYLSHLGDMLERQMADRAAVHVEFLGIEHVAFICRSSAKLRVVDVHVSRARRRRAT